MNPKKSPDIWLFAAAIALLVIGVFMVYDASYAVAGQRMHSSAYFLKKQAVFAVIGLVLMFAFMHFRYWKLRPLASALLIASIFGLMLVFVPGFGVSVNGAKRWIHIGPIQLQPSEFAKLGLVTYLAAVLSDKKQAIRDWQRELLPMAIPIGIVALLIVKEDMGTAIVVVVTALGMIYMAGARKRHLFGAIGVLLPVAIGFICKEHYRLHRIISFLDPFKDYHGNGYQVCQSLIALGSGGIFGTGLCEGQQKLFFLPESHTDFIFAVYGQETGLIGTVILSGLFIFFAVRGFKIAFETKEGFGRLLAAGLTSMIVIQALLNMYVVTSSVPATGVPLPFISYGGSSLALNLLCVGILLGISRYPKPVEGYLYEGRVNRRRNRRARVSRR